MPQIDKSSRLPLPAVTEVDRLPPWVLGGDPMQPALVPGRRLDMRVLARFRTLMARAGEEVQVHRMRYDRRYAFERIVRAHDSADRKLRSVVLELIDHYVGQSMR